MEIIEFIKIDCAENEKAPLRQKWANIGASSFLEECDESEEKGENVEVSQNSEGYNANYDNRPMRKCLHVEKVEEQEHSQNKKRCMSSVEECDENEEKGENVEVSQNSKGYNSNYDNRPIRKCRHVEKVEEPSPNKKRCMSSVERDVSSGPRVKQSLICSEELCAQVSSTSRQKLSGEEISRNTKQSISAVEVNLSSKRGKNRRRIPSWEISSEISRNTKQSISAIEEISRNTKQSISAVEGNLSSKRGKNRRRIPSWEKSADERCNSSRPIRQCRGDQKPPSEEEIERIGELVFAKYIPHAKFFWPGIIVDGRQVGNSPAYKAKNCIFWFAENLVSWVYPRYIKPFTEFENQNKSKIYQKAITEGLELAAERANLNPRNDLLAWADRSFDGASLEPDHVTPVPGYINDILQSIQEAKQKNSDDACRPRPKAVKKNGPDKTQFSIARFQEKYGRYMLQCTYDKLVARITPGIKSLKIVQTNEKHSLTATPNFKGDDVVCDARVKTHAIDCTQQVSPPASPMTSSLALASISEDIIEMPDSTSTTQLKNSEEEMALLVDEGIGKIVWAKFQKKYYPGILIKGKDCGQENANPGNSWIFWFKNNKVSLIRKNNTEDFMENFKELLPKGKEQPAVVESLQIIAERMGYVLSDNELKDWAMSGFPKLCNNEKKTRKPQDGTVSSSDLIPLSVRKQLNQIIEKYGRTSNLNSDSSESEDESDLCMHRPKKITYSISTFNSGLCPVKQICLGCTTYNVEVQHPLFIGGLCQFCKEEFRKTIFALGNDGKNLFCVVCGHEGDVFVCGNADCSRSYCYTCIDRWTAPGSKKEIEQMEPWSCFMCAKQKKTMKAQLECRSDWEDRLFKFFHSHWNPNNGQIPTKKGPITVLSLFDGIGTGHYVLELLNLKIQTYYASEIDENATCISHLHYKNIVKLGDVTSITEEWLIKHAPCIDIIIGGSPCNDLSLVNPQRKGFFDFTGTGFLFFEFLRILKILEQARKGKPLFFLFENVYSMPIEYREIISECFGCRPLKLNSMHFSAQNRERLYWGNIPGMEYIQAYWNDEKHKSDTPTHYLGEDITLKNYLQKKPGRTAVVKKIRTVTTSWNSLFQDRNKLMPVLEKNGKYDTLWTNELERIFGFPEHYTDFKNLSASHRLRLLGKSWCVQVIRYLLLSLTCFFETGYSNKQMLTKNSLVVDKTLQKY